MNIRDVRRLYSIQSILGTSRRKIVCPLPQHIHHNYTPSFSIRNASDGAELFICHGNCGLRGDVIDLIGYMNIPGYEQHKKEDVERAISLLTGTHHISEPAPPVKRAVLGIASLEMLDLPDARTLEFCESRGLSPSTVEKFRLRQNGNRLAIPTFEFDQLVGIKYRSMDGYGSRYTSEPGSRIGLFNLDNVIFTQEPVLILKGEIAAMVLDQHGFLSCAPSGGEAATLAEWEGYLHFSRRRVVVGDNDPERIAKQTKVLAQERAEILEAELRFPPAQYKDIDEWVLGDPDAVEEIKSWLEN